METFPTYFIWEWCRIFTPAKLLLLKLNTRNQVSWPVQAKSHWQQLVLHPRVFLPPPPGWQWPGHCPGSSPLAPGPPGWVPGWWWSGGGGRGYGYQTGSPSQAQGMCSVFQAIRDVHDWSERSRHSYIIRGDSTWIFQWATRKYGLQDFFQKSSSFLGQGYFPDIAI